MGEWMRSMLRIGIAMVTRPILLAKPVKRFLIESLRTQV